MTVYCGCENCENNENGYCYAESIDIDMVGMCLSCWWAIDEERECDE